MKSQPAEPDHEAIPSIGRNKCCFTLERLRLAQSSLPVSPTIDSPDSKTPSSTSRPPLIRTKSLSYLKPTRRSKKPTSPSNDHFSTADARWYLKLPPKVQRKHFTEDEQFILAGHCEPIPLEPRGKAVSQLRRGSNRSDSTLRVSSASSEDSVYFEAEQEPADSAIDMDDSMMDKLRWMDDKEIDLKLYDYHTHFIEASSPRKFWSSHRRPSFRRPMTSPAPIPPASSSSFITLHTLPSDRIPTPVDESFSATCPSNPTTNNRETMNFLPIHQNRPSTDSSTTRHYQDPEARLKLRVYLASASKFDEAIEFGFPSLEDDKENTTFLMQGSRPSLSTHHYNTAPAAAQKTFFDDSSPSVFNAFDFPASDEDDDKDCASLPDLDMPRTPCDAVFGNTHRLPTTSSAMDSELAPRPSSKRPSVDSPSELQTSLKPKIRYLAPDGNREMTLRMTLTRPDLRSAEETRLHGEPGDPLALEELPPTRNGRTLWDEPPKQTGIVRKIWMRVSGKGCQL